MVLLFSCQVCLLIAEKNVNKSFLDLAYEKKILFVSGK